MVKLDKHISELLFDHECVIVPELGGFLSSYTPSRINPAQHLVVPPSKKIAFNVFLRQNDGLLANYLVQAEGLTYPEALYAIGNYVDNCHKELSAGKKCVIERVGILTRDTETNLQFEPFNNVNYLKDSFGLSPVQFIPVQHNDFEEEVEKQLRDFISLRPSQPQPRQGVIIKKIRLNALNSMLLAGSVMWFCLNLYIVSPKNVNLATLNPFSVSVKNGTSAPVSSDEGKSEIYTQPSVAKAETVYVKATSPETVPAPPAVKLEEAISKKTSAPNFFIIAGAFNSIVNATKKEAALKSQGFANAHIIENKDGLKLVCYDGYSTREEAFTELNRMKSLNKEGWIFPR
ncbi:SPOR domain-containing protein [soil metagenome]